ncbi:hypothetical protein [uncultured Marivirga sp.]|uniref:hypothetical protein n=1 Tax=uncultured Marivirga sp. TaxID=1123707 RepID=UPI0030EE2B15
MKSHFNYLLILLAFILIASSCQKEDIKVEDELPPITQEGLNTFGCKIDGEVLVPKDGDPSLFVGSRKGLIAGNPHAGENPVKSYFFIRVLNAQDEGGDYIFLYIPELEVEGEYELGNSTGSTPYENNSPNHAIVISYDGETAGKRYLSFEGGGDIVIDRYDTINTIISGTFEFDVIKESDPLSDTISVTDGRFDINWSRLNEEE